MRVGEQVSLQQMVWEDGGVLTRREEQSPILMRAWATSFPGGSFAIDMRA